jgi:hypothetical protein
VLWFFLTLLFLIIAAWVFIHTPWGQNWITRQVTKHFSKELKTKISIQHVDFSLFNSMHLKGVMVEDQRQDTLIYAGDLQVRITDWFFFKKNIELKYIGLEDAVIKFQRSDSVWSQQFLFDYFSSSDTSTKKSTIALNLKRVAMKNVTFIKKDGWIGDDMLVHLGALQLTADNISLDKKIIDARSLIFTQPQVSLRNYDGNRPGKKQELTYPETADSLLRWNKDGWVMNFKSIKIENGRFTTDKESDEPILKTFDGRHIDFNHINGDFTDVKWINDTISARLQLQTKERSGFEVKQMVTEARFSPAGMFFNKLDIQTNNSIIKNYFAMGYDEFDDMDDFIHKIKLTADFDSTTVNSDDIAYFAPELATWKKNISLKGKIRGTIDELVGKNLLIRAGNNTLLNGDITLMGLPDINETFIDFKANDFRTTYADAAAIIPELRKVVSPDLRKINYLRFKGSFNGFIRDFVTFGTIETNLGIVHSDLNMKLPRKQDPVYSGNISTDNFQLGEFFNTPNLGSLSMSGVIKGKGLKENTVNTNFEGKINYIDFYNYRYNNISMKGKLEKQFFDGFASINDPNLDLSMDGKIDFNGKAPVFDLYATINKANFQPLQWTKDNVSFKGNVNFNFSGKNLDEFMGTAKIFNAELAKDGTLLPFDSLVVSSSEMNGVKTLTALSNEFDATITGQYSIHDLPDAVKLFLNKYYPSLIKAPLIPPKDEAFTFDITTRNIEDYIGLIDKNLKGFDYSHITGRVDLSNNHFDIDAEVPNFSYQNYVFTGTELKGVGTLSRLSLYGKAGNTKINDSLNLPLTVFKIDAAGDSSQVSITTGSNLPVNKASVNAMVQVFDNGLKIRFDTSFFVINGKTWNLEKNGILQFGDQLMESGKLLLRESNQEISLTTEPSAKGNWNDLNITLKKVNIGDFSAFLLPKNRLEGLATGKITVEDPYRKFNIKTDLLTENVLLDGDTLGSFNTIAEYNHDAGELIGKGKNLDPEHKLDYDFHLYLKDSANKFEDVINLGPENYPVKILERFIGNLFSDLQGYATGKLKIIGKGDNRKYIGKPWLHDGGLKVNFTQCFYKIEDTYIDLRANEINLDGIVLRDPVTNNPVYVRGNIYHNSFRDMFFNISVSTRKPFTAGTENNRPVLLLNTTINDNKQFYGKVKGTGLFELTGPESEMFMKIDAIASKTDSGYVTIPPIINRETGMADFLIEKKYGREMNEEGAIKNPLNIIYDVDVTASPSLSVKVVLDELTGDEIKGHGEGTLNIHAGTSEPLTMRGKINIIDGNYVYSFQSLFKKPFDLRKGADNYIEWTDDPMKAAIHFDAVYKADKVSFSPLANAIGDPAINRYRDDVYIVATMTGELFKPQFDFKLEFPPNSKASTDPAITFNIHQIEKNPGEINRQVAFLIVFNSFAPIENTTTTTNLGSAFNEFAYSTITSISGLVFNEINRALNKALSKILNTDNLSINFSGSLYNRNLLDQQGSNSFNINQGNLNINVPISLFKDRFVISLGGAFDVPLQASIQQQNTSFLPDVTAEWLINPSGTVRATFFYRQNLDYLSSTSTGAGRTKRQGASIAYKRDFDTLKELFSGKKKKAQKQEPKPEEKSEENPEN